MPTISAAAAETDIQRLRDLARYTALTFDGPSPSPFGCDIVATATGKRLYRGVNNVRREFDPSAHAELRAVRRACKKLRATSLAGFTLYTTCEPCPMCMGSILWAGVDRVIYGATISDAAKHCWQIYVPAKTLAKKSDMSCEVIGPVARKECYALFTHPTMEAAMQLWRHKK